MQTFREVVKVRFKKLCEGAVTPSYAHGTDAGLDLTAVRIAYDGTEGCVVYGTGIAVEIPQGYVGLVFPRSSICKKDLFLTNSVGVIDSGYRGEILVKYKPSLKLIPVSGNAAKVSAMVDIPTIRPKRQYAIGERVAQLIILPYPKVELEEAAELTESERGTGGYGSTGK